MLKEIIIINHHLLLPLIRSLLFRSMDASIGSRQMKRLLDHYHIYVQIIFQF